MVVRQQPPSLKLPDSLEQPVYSLEDKEPLLNGLLQRRGHTCSPLAALPKAWDPTKSRAVHGLLGVWSNWKLTSKLVVRHGERVALYEWL